MLRADRKLATPGFPTNICHIPLPTYTPNTRLGKTSVNMPSPSQSLGSEIYPFIQLRNPPSTPEDFSSVIGASGEPHSQNRHHETRDGNITSVNGLNSAERGPRIACHSSDEPQCQTSPATQSPVYAGPHKVPASCGSPAIMVSSRR